VLLALALLLPLALLVAVLMVVPPWPCPAHPVELVAGAALALAAAATHLHPTCCRSPAGGGKGRQCRSRAVPQQPSTPLWGGSCCASRRGPHQITRPIIGRAWNRHALHPCRSRRRPFEFLQRLPAASYLCRGADVDAGYSLPPVFRSGESLPLSCIWCRLMTESNAAVVIRGLALPPLLGVQLGLYLDRCPAGFGPVGVWRDCWGAGRVRTLGFDLLGVRLRVVVERVPTAILSITRPGEGDCTAKGLR